MIDDANCWPGPAAGSVLSRSLRTAANAAAQVLEHFIVPHACGENDCQASLLEQTACNAQTSSISHAAPAQPIRRQVRAYGHGQQRQKVLRASMANRLVELTTLHGSQEACPPLSATGKLAERMEEHPMKAQEHAQVAQTSINERQLPRDTLTQLQIKPSTSAVQISSRV